MSYIHLNEEELVRMYSDPDTTVKTMQRHFGVTSGTIYRHLKSQGIDSNRKTSIPWTEEENNQLISGREEGLTGAELYEKIPTRDPAAIKSHTQKLRIDKLIR
jgi:transposase-like protein